MAKTSSVVSMSDMATKHKAVVEVPAEYQVKVSIKGVAPLLMHRYDISDVESKGAAPKGSKQKKTDNIESYVYRNDKGECCIPGVMFKASLCSSAKFERDPRSPRKSAYDLFRAGIVCDGNASLGKDTWDFLDKRPVVVQMSRVARTRPAFTEGWRCEFIINILLPEYIHPDLLNEVVVRAGKVCGLGDFRPDFGRFMIESFKVLEQ